VIRTRCRFWKPCHQFHQCHLRLQERTPAAAKIARFGLQLCRSGGRVTSRWAQCLHSLRYRRCVKTMIGPDVSRLRFQERQEFTIARMTLHIHLRRRSYRKHPRSPCSVALCRAYARHRLTSRSPRASLHSVQQVRQQQRLQAHQRHGQRHHHHRQQQQKHHPANAPASEPS
jgi:hypothetical protein